jgi:hypothetical protein
MHKVPPIPVLKSLLGKLLRVLAPNAKKEKELLEFFFRRALDGDSSPATAKDILAEHPDRFESENGIYNVIGRIKDVLKEFFDDNRSEPIRVELEAGSHVLRFTRNRAPCPRVQRFWEPYFLSLGETVLYYPEPQFFRHRNGTYIRHARANSLERPSDILELFRIDKADLIPSYSFVPSGLAAAMASLFACFHANDSDLRAKPLSPTAPLPELSENAIVLATPTTSLNLISSLERDWTMRTRRDNDRSVFRAIDPATGKERLYTDEIQEEQDFDKTSQQLVKWAIVTRRVEPAATRDDPAATRVVTVLSGHSRSVQGITDFLTTEEKIKPLFPGRLPKTFQILFKVAMRKFYGELEKASASIEFVRKMDERAHRQNPG